MIPEELKAFLPVFQIFISFAIFFSLFAIGVFLGLAVYDFQETSGYSKSKKILLTIAMFLFPEIGVICWVFLFSKHRKLIFRIVAFCTSGFYFLLQVSMYIVGHDLSDISHGVTNIVMMHCLWLPFIVIGGGIAFFVFRSIFSDKTSKKESRNIIS